MDDPLSRGLPFELADIWRRSTLHVRDDENSIFAPLEASFPDLQLDVRQKDVENELFIPPLNETHRASDDFQDFQPPDSDIASPRLEIWDTGQPDSDHPASVWDLDPSLHLPPDRPCLRTWEAFEKKEVPNADRTAYLSEAGPRAFDALLAERAGKSNGVLPQDVMLRALCNLALGRESVFFQWDDQKATFTRTLADVPISGYSSTTCDSLMQLLVEYAILYRSLRQRHIDLRPRRDSGQCLVAFHGCVGSILDAIEEYITTQALQVRSILQLQALIQQPHKLLYTLNTIRRSFNNATSDEDIISALSNHVHDVVSTDSSSGGILRTLLERTSAPWLENLAIELGLVDDPARAGSTHPVNDVEMPSARFDSSVSSARPEDGETTDLVSGGDRALMWEIKSSLGVLRHTLPHYRGDEGARKLYQASLHRDTESKPLHQVDTHGFEDSVEAVYIPAMDEGLVWADQDVQYNSLARADERMSETPHSPDHLDTGIRTAVLTYCNAAEDAVDLSTSLMVDIHPLDRLRPALSAQNRHLNRTLLRHLFNSDLTHHLLLQYSYHFLTSGKFVSRLSTALFSADTQSAQRRRGTIPTAQTMGLRLGARNANEQRWPPASSELRLTLMDILIETYKADYPSFSTKQKQSKELPGGLSFSIRELPEHEIERVLDPSSIFALDFLRLQYAAPPPLDAVLTPASMRVYDSIFRQLLRLHRVVNVTASLRRDVVEEKSPLMVRFAQSAHLFIITLLSHTMDIGIAAPWRALPRRFEAAERSLHNHDEEVRHIIGIEALQQMHMICLDTIRSRLFLRQKQDKLRLAVEEVLSAILKGAVVVQTNLVDEDTRKTERMVEIMADFERAVKDMLGLLRSAVEKPPKTKTTMSMNTMSDGFDENDDNQVMRLLLERLDWNGFYSGTDSPTSI